MKKILLLAILVSILGACDRNEPSKKCSGSIIATLGCYDEETRSTFYKGFFIATNHNDTVLSFNLNVNDSINVPYGICTTHIIPIPYSFSFTIIEPNDERYVHYAPIIQAALLPIIPKPLDEIEQVIITPIK